MSFLSNKSFVEKTPILTTFLLEYANIGQLYRMWTEHSALGQNVWSWLAVNIALWLWLNYYLVMIPGGKKSIAFIATAIGIVLNSAVILSVAYFRWIV